MYCIHCGKEISDDALFCPHCGGNQETAAASSETTAPAPAPAPAPVVAPTKKPVNWLGIVGFVISLLSIYLGVYYLIASVVAVVLSAVGLGLKNKYSANGLAIAGIVIGALSLAFWGFMWLLIGSIIAGISGIANDIATVQIIPLI